MLYIHSSNGTFVINNSLILPVWWGTQWFMKHALMWLNSLSPALRRIPEREHLWWKSTSHFFSPYHGYAMRKILPLCRKTVTFKSKGFLCLFSHNSRIHCFWLKNLNLFSQNITFLVINHLNLVEKIIRTWNVDEVSVPIISKDIH